MRYKKYGDTELSVICMGTWTLGGMEYGPIEEKEGIASVHAMLDNGVNFIDTAPAYALGAAETLLGKALKGRRDKVFLVSKCGTYWPGGKKDYTRGGPERDSSKKRVLMQIEESLERLQTDYLDALLIHWPDVNTPMAETVSAFDELKKQGKIRYSGMSNFDSPLVDEMFDLGGLQVAQYPYSMVNRTREEYLKKFAVKGVLTMGYAALGAGILTGSIRTLTEFPRDDARGGFYDFFREPKFSKVMELLKTLDKIAAERNVPLAQIAVNWALQHDFIYASITGVRNKKEADENCAAVDWMLTDEEIKMIDTAIADTIEKE
jgi:aryl-alcohol dehydrogenase-like predicted oxidoreductase